MAAEASNESNDAGQMALVKIRPIDCSGACSEPATGCGCSGVWRDVDVVMGVDGKIVAAPLLPSGQAVQDAAASLAGGTKSLSQTHETA